MAEWTAPPPLHRHRFAPAMLQGPAHQAVVGSVGALSQFGYLREHPTVVVRVAPPALVSPFAEPHLTWYKVEAEF